MKEENITLNINVSEQEKEIKGNNKEYLDNCFTKLDDIGVMLEKIKAFNQLINIKLDEVENPHTDLIKKECTLNSLAIDLFKIQSNIRNYIMLSYCISDMTSKIDKEIQSIYEVLKNVM